MRGDVKFSQTIAFAEFPQSIKDFLQLVAPPFSSGSVYRQLNYIENYVRDDLNAKSVLLEDHYIDRDYMEDHSVFYSRCLQPYTNSCRRIHFFNADKETVEAGISRLLETCSTTSEHGKACREFSDQLYLGFMVVKPLSGCPVGRTILRCLPNKKDDGSIRSFDSARDYKAHFGPITFTVRGLSFQQQDVGVSACATTAIWSAVQKVREFEDIGSATPAQITQLATKHALPFGRPMPSEGLSLDQMCQAIQSIGISPHVFRQEDFKSFRGLIYSCMKSEGAPILIIRRNGSDLIPDVHAVPIVGMKLKAAHTETLVSDIADDLAGDLLALYVHDDRIGPYLRANVVEIKNKLILKVHPDEKHAGQFEEWEVTHLLVPGHVKIRLSFGELRKLALKIVGDVRTTFSTIANSDAPIQNIQFEATIRRGNTYLLDSLAPESRISAGAIRYLMTTTPLPKYTGIVRLNSPSIGHLDILLDTTSTMRNVHCHAVIVGRESPPLTDKIAAVLAAKYGCDLIG